MGKYIVKTRFIFEGEFVVQAKSSQEARESIEKHCGLVLGGDIHTTLSDEDVEWDFNSHPTKRIISVKKD